MPAKAGDILDCGESRQAFRQFGIHGFNTGVGFRSDPDERDDFLRRCRIPLGDLGGSFVAGALGGFELLQPLCLFVLLATFREPAFDLLRCDLRVIQIARCHSKISAEPRPAFLSRKNGFGPAAFKFLDRCFARRDMDTGRFRELGEFSHRRRLLRGRREGLLDTIKQRDHRLPIEFGGCGVKAAASRRPRSQ
ncbi:hypothetical protein QO014_003184 [Kaistia dalseonensis]|uniref:Uncharacterized protein n=1 Tax=Kaistia dalseonensis TaxID=410840 RepID=A0ABU0H8Z9_9HYPH|nr:hypothetical protein [Kaistia dalseonensis]MDQ0438789.1 hypothetical protein [Kaistia dalseonensis]